MFGGNDQIHVLAIATICALQATISLWLALCYLHSCKLNLILVQLALPRSQFAFHSDTKQMSDLYMYRNRPFSV